MKDQRGDGDEWFDIEGKSFRVRHNDQYQFEIKRKHLSDRLFVRVFGMSALASIGIMLGLWFFATGGDFNLIEWVREWVQGVCT